MITIVDNILSPHSISDLAGGATFKYTSEYFIKLGTECKDAFGPYNAVRLSDGKPVFFNEDTELTLFNCELIVL